MKKLIAMLLCIVMVLGLFAGCNTEKPQPSKNPDPVGTTSGNEPAPTTTEDPGVPLGALPLVKEGEEVTISIGLKQNANTEDYETNEYTLWIEEQTGINLEFVYFANDNTEALNQLNAMVGAGQELPDILWGMDGCSDALRNELGNNEYILDLKPYFDTDAYWFWEMYEIMAPSARDTVFNNWNDPTTGALYGFPGAGEVGVDAAVAMACINKDWLAAVNKEVPTTVDELYDVLVAFRDGDPNGNGQADEIPMMGYSSGGYRTQIVDYIINAYCYYNGVSNVNVTDGKVWTPFNTNEYREALKYLHKLYSEGLLGSAYYTITASSEYKTLVSSDLVGIGGIHPLLHLETDSELLYAFTGMTPLKAETELGGYAGLRPGTGSCVTFITADCENPQLAFRLLDFMTCNPDSYANQRYGVEGRDWVRCENGETSYLGIEVMINAVDTSVWSNQNNVLWHKNYSFAPQSVTGTAWSNDGTWKGDCYLLLHEIYQQWHSVAEPEVVIGKLVYNAEETEMITEISSPIADYIKEKQALFISGVLDPNDNAAWDTYLAELEAQGLSKYLECAQAAYDRMSK